MVKNTLAYQYRQREQPQEACALNITVQNNDCLVMAKSISQQTNEPVCVLNLANQFEVGGDYLNLTAYAQEESLIKRTNLLDSLIQLEGVVRGNVCNPYKYALPNCLGFSSAQQSSGFGEFTCLYSADITVNNLSTEETGSVEPFSVNVISSAAYNLNDRDNAPDAKLYLAGTVFKILNQLRTAKAHGQRHLVLGAFGCGAFNNSSAEIASIYHAAIYEFEFQGCFDSICFAIKSSTSGTAINNYQVFCQEFSGFPKFLYPFLEDACELLKTSGTTNHVLEEMLSPFNTLGSQEELAYLASRVIHQELKLSPILSALKKNFLNHILLSLKNKPGSARDMLDAVLSSTMLRQLYPRSSFFKATPFVVTKFEGLLKRLPVVIPNLTMKQINWAQELTDRFILPKIDRFVASVADDEKQVICFMLYLAIQTNAALLKREFRQRGLYASQYDALRQLLIAIHHICQGIDDANQIVSEITSPPVCAEGTVQEVTASLGRYISHKLETFLSVQYASYFTISEFNDTIYDNESSSLDDSAITSRVIVRARV